MNISTLLRTVSNYRIPVPIFAFDNAVDVTCDPTAVEVSRLRLNFLTIHKTVPRTSIERQVIFDSLKAIGRPFVGPDPVRDRLSRTCRVRNAPIGGSTLPLAVGRPCRLYEGNLDGRGRKIVCWRMMSLECPVCVLCVSYQMAIPFDLQVPRCLLQERRPWEGLDVELCLGRHSEDVHMTQEEI